MILNTSNDYSIFRVSPGNFGDDLNEVLIERQLGDHFNRNLFSSPLQDYQCTDKDNIIIAIGTILNKRVPCKGNKIVLGAGAGYGDIPVIDNKWDVKFVRGPLTAKELELDKSQIITDPAILLADKGFEYRCKYKFGYAPHHGCANCEWENVCNDLGILYIDPRLDFQQVKTKLLSCETLITEAMHGAIVADAYRIPWIPVKTANKINNFKWNDWCGSLELNYNPLKLAGLWSLNRDCGAVKKAYQRIKRQTVKYKLQNIMRRSKPMLSNENIYQDRLIRVRDAYDSFFANL